MPVKKKTIIKNKNVNKNSIKININTKRKVSKGTGKPRPPKQVPPSVNVYSNVSIPPYHPQQQPIYIREPTTTLIKEPVFTGEGRTTGVREPVFTGNGNNPNQPVSNGLDATPPIGNIPPVEVPTPHVGNIPDIFATPSHNTTPNNPALTLTAPINQREPIPVRRGTIYNPITGNFIQDTQKNRNRVNGVKNKKKDDI